MIRRAVPTDWRDARGILEAHRAAIRGTAGAFYSREIIEDWGGLPITDDTVARFIESKGKGEVITVAEHDDEIVGFSEVLPADNELRAVYVAPAFGRGGIGTLLLQAAEVEARTAACRRLELVSSINARAFYERNGYRMIRSDEHTLGSGRKMLCFVMEKVLL
jgi:putative acetyltransferase